MRKTVNDLIATLLDTAVLALCQHQALAEHCEALGLSSPNAEDIAVYIDTYTGKAGWLWVSNPAVKAIERDPEALIIRAVQIAEPGTDGFVGLSELSARLAVKTIK